MWNMDVLSNANLSLSSRFIYHLLASGWTSKSISETLHIRTDVLCYHKTKLRKNGYDFPDIKQKVVGTGTNVENEIGTGTNEENAQTDEKSLENENRDPYNNESLKTKALKALKNIGSDEVKPTGWKKNRQLIFDSPYSENLCKLGEYFYGKFQHTAPYSPTDTPAPYWNSLNEVRLLLEKDWKKEDSHTRIPHLRKIIKIATTDPFWQRNLKSLASIRKDGGNGPKWLNIENNADPVPKSTTLQDAPIRPHVSTFLPPLPLYQFAITH